MFNSVLGTGYVRSEGVMVIYVCKRKDAKRVYGTVVACANNNDGNKDTSKFLSNIEILSGYPCSTPALNDLYLYRKSFVWSRPTR